MPNAWCRGWIKSVVSDAGDDVRHPVQHASDDGDHAGDDPVVVLHAHGSDVRDSHAHNGAERYR